MKISNPLFKTSLPLLLIFLPLWEMHDIHRAVTTDSETFTSIDQAVQAAFKFDFLISGPLTSLLTAFFFFAFLRLARSLYLPPPQVQIERNGVEWAALYAVGIAVIAFAGSFWSHDVPPAGHLHLAIPGTGYLPMIAFLGIGVVDSCRGHIPVWLTYILVFFIFLALEALGQTHLYPIASLVKPSVPFFEWNEFPHDWRYLVPSLPVIGLAPTYVRLGLIPTLAFAVITSLLARAGIYLGLSQLNTAPADLAIFALFTLFLFKEQSSEL